MNRQPGMEPVHSSVCTLRQFYCWICKCEDSFGNLWERLSGSRIDEIKQETREFHAGGGYQGMTWSRFYLTENFMREFDDSETFYLIIASLMLLPFDIWDHVEIDLSTLKFWISQDGSVAYKKWCEANPDKHFNTPELSSVKGETSGQR